MIKARINSVRLHLMTQQRVVFLQDEAGRTVLPIWVSAADAVALAIGLQEKPLARPMMPQLTVNLLQAAGTQIEEARIEAWKENVFYAVVKMRNGNVIQEIDARPSDALTLAVLADCPIYISEGVMQQQGKQIPEGETIETFLEQESQKNEQQREALFSRLEEEYTKRGIPFRREEVEKKLRELTTVYPKKVAAMLRLGTPPEHQPEGGEQAYQGLVAALLGEPGRGETLEQRGRGAGMC